jgi:hypothetical protein
VHPPGCWPAVRAVSRRSSSAPDVRPSLVAPPAGGRRAYRGTAVRPESLDPPLEAPLGDTVAPPPDDPPDDEDEDSDDDEDDEDDDDEDEEDPPSLGPDLDVAAVRAEGVFVFGTDSRGTTRV